MYEENKPSTLINDVQEWPNFFCAILVRSAMPNKNVNTLSYTIHTITPVCKQYKDSAYVHVSDFICLTVIKLSYEKNVSP